MPLYKPWQLPPAPHPIGHWHSTVCHLTVRILSIAYREVSDSNYGRRSSVPSKFLFCFLRFFPTIAGIVPYNRQGLILSYIFHWVVRSRLAVQLLKKIVIYARWLARECLAMGIHIRLLPSKGSSSRIACRRNAVSIPRAVLATSAIGLTFSWLGFSLCSLPNCSRCSLLRLRIPSGSLIGASQIQVYHHPVFVLFFQPLVPVHNPTPCLCRIRQYSVCERETTYCCVVSPQAGEPLL
jgi:hypothetical protein